MNLNGSVVGEDSRKVLPQEYKGRDGIKHVSGKWSRGTFQTPTGKKCDPRLSLPPNSAAV